MPYNDTDLRILVTFSEEMVFGFIEERYNIRQKHKLQMGTIFPTQKSTKTLKKTDNSAMSALNKYKNDIAQRGTT